MLLFTAEIAATNEYCVELPGFSHWSEPRLKYGTQGPLIRIIYFGAKSRSQAGKQLQRICGINTPCALSEGKKSTLITAKMQQRIQEWK